MTSLIEEHRVIESSLERLAESIAAGRIDADVFRHVADLVAEHYRREETFLAQLQLHEPGLAAKLRAQHDEALEIAARLAESLDAGQNPDAIYLARRFLAIAQHNIIEEERDVFPLFLNSRRSP